MPTFTENGFWDEQTCAFPSGNPGEPGFGFCGLATAPDKSYCPFHCRIAYIGHHERQRRLSEMEMEVKEALQKIYKQIRRRSRYRHIRPSAAVDQMAML